MQSGGLPIGALAKQSGSNIETIRYYERIGLIPAPPRQGRYRSYSEDDANRLRFVRRARELGFTLKEVRALMALASGGQTSCDEARALAANHLADVRLRIADLRRMEHVLADTILVCETGNDRGCPLIDSLHGANPAVFKDDTLPVLKRRRF